MIWISVCVGLFKTLVEVSSRRSVEQTPPPALTFVLFQPLDRDEPNGRPQWRFTVFAQDEGGNGLVGYADVQVNLKDINDNAPLFPQGE